jgi:hypothetical protein
VRSPHAGDRPHNRFAPGIIAAQSVHNFITIRWHGECQVAAIVPLDCDKQPDAHSGASDDCANRSSRDGLRIVHGNAAHACAVMAGPRVGWGLE